MPPAPACSIPAISSRRPSCPRTSTQASSSRPDSIRRAQARTPSRNKRRFQGVIADVTKGADNDETPGTATARPQRAGLPMAQAALRFARARHAGQRREVDHAAFIAHPIEVGSLLRRDGQPDEIIVAGLLHDVLEKTATTSAELHRRFGAQIARLVESVSDDPSIGDYKARKRELRDRVARGDSNTRAIFAADKIAKVRELALLPARRLGDTKVRAELAHYRASLEMLRRVDGDVTLVACLDAELKQLVARAVSGARSAAPIASATSLKRNRCRTPTI